MNNRSPLLMALSDHPPPATAKNWLDGIARRADVFLSMEDIEPEAVEHAKQARKFTRLALGGIEHGQDVTAVAMRALHHAYMADIHQGAMERLNKYENSQLHNRRVAAAKDAARNKAKELWEADVNQEIRIGKMGKDVRAYLLSEYKDVLPKPENMKDWIKGVAPEYASKRGAPKKRK